MQQKPERGVPQEEHQTGLSRKHINWENIHIFLAVIRGGSFRSAAERLGSSLNTVRRRVRDLEYEVGFLLLTRHVDGVQITDEGSQFLKAAEKMEQASFEALRQTNFEPLSGTVRISVTEGLGTLWVIPQVVEFQRANPKLIMEVNCTMREADLLRMEADIGILLQKPTNPDLICTRLGTLHIMPFAAREYLDLFGKPNSLEEVPHHKIVEQKSAQIDSDAVDRLFPDVPKEGFISVRTNTSSAHYLAVAKGAGIGMLPTYAYALGAHIEPVDLKLHLRYEIWMSYHSDLAKNKRVRLTLEWLKSSFSCKKYPWFQDKFIHPSDFNLTPKQRTISYLLKGFFGN